MKTIATLLDVAYTLVIVFFELLIVGIFLSICIAIPMGISYAIVNNGNHIFDPVVALVIAAGLVALISIE
jgi:ABC-type proline/glycine betaine transport system permease subunit